MYIKRCIVFNISNESVCATIVSETIGIKRLSETGVDAIMSV